MRTASDAKRSLRTVPKIRASEVPCLLSGCLTDGEEDDHVREEGRGRSPMEHSTQVVTRIQLKCA